MADRFRISYERALRRMSGRFENLSKEMDQELEATVTAATDLLYDQAQANIRETFKTSGKMANALQRRVNRVGPGHVVGSVFIRGIGYVVQERGGTHPYRIVPRERDALKFFNGKFSMWANRDPLPRRSYLGLALNQKRAEIRTLFQAFGGKAWVKTE